MTVRQLLTRAILVIGLALVAAAVGYGLTAGQAKTYQATAELLFAPRSNPLTQLGVGSGPLDQGSAVANNVLEVGSYDMSRATAQALGDPRFDADAVNRDVKVGAKGGDVVGLVAQTHDPQLAARLLRVYVQQVIHSEQHHNVTESRIARAALVDELNHLPPSVRDTPRGDTLRQQIGELDVFLRVGNAPTLLQRVTAQQNATGPPVARNTLFGLLFGAVLGIGLVAARSAMRPARREY